MPEKWAKCTQQKELSVFCDEYSKCLCNFGDKILDASWFSISYNMLGLCALYSWVSVPEYPLHHTLCSSGDRFSFGCENNFPSCPMITQNALGCLQQFGPCVHYIPAYSICWRNIVLIRQEQRIWFVWFKLLKWKYFSCHN